MFSTTSMFWPCVEILKAVYFLKCSNFKSSVQFLIFNFVLITLYWALGMDGISRFMIKNYLVPWGPVLGLPPAPGLFPWGLFHPGLSPIRYFPLQLFSTRVFSPGLFNPVILTFDLDWYSMRDPIFLWEVTKTVHQQSISKKKQKKKEIEKLGVERT